MHLRIIAVCAFAALLLAGAMGGTAQAREKCKSGLTNIYKDDYVVAKVVTDWCYNGRSVTSRHSVPSARVRNAAYSAGLREDGAEWVYTSCHTYKGIKNHNCLTKMQFAFNYTWNKFAPKIGVCISTRIYGNGAHKRSISTNC